MVHRAGNPKAKLYAANASGLPWRVTESGNPPLAIVLNDVTGWIRGTADTEGLLTLSATGGALSTNNMEQVKNLGAFSVEPVPGDHILVGAFG
jgi:hypothetical protein